MTHWPGFVSAMESRGAAQHPVFDAEIMEALAEAWKSRRALGLSAKQVSRIERVVHGVAMGRFYRWPAIALNQLTDEGAEATFFGREVHVTREGSIIRVNVDGTAVPGFREMWFIWATFNQDDGVVWDLSE